MAKPRKTIAFVVYPGFTPLDLVGTATSLRAADMRRYEMVVVGERLEPVPSDTPLQVVPAKTFDDVPAPAIVVIPGATDRPLQALENAALTAYVRKVGAAAEIVVGVSSGALVLGAAGLLERQAATTHWAYAELLHRFGARYVDQPWVDTGKVVTAAGISGAVDVGLALAARLSSVAVAQGLQLSMEYDPQPPFGPIDWQRVDLTDPAEVLPPEQAAELAAFFLPVLTPSRL